MKRHKAAGPDGMCIEALKEMDDWARGQILDILNNWWIDENIPSELLLARVVLLYKKHDSANWGNYRPISLLNSTTKIFAHI